MARSLDGIRTGFEERFSSVWKLLFETERFLGKTPLFAEYENRFRLWRRQLQENQNVSNRLAEIRGEIVAFRKELRRRGYNLRLSGYDLRIEGFRSDDALGQGFARAVLAVMPGGFVAHNGQANHIELHGQLSSRLDSGEYRERLRIHSLWYRWEGQLLVLSGSDSETAEDFERLRRLAPREAMRIIAAFDRL